MKDNYLAPMLLRILSETEEELEGFYPYPEGTVRTDEQVNQTLGQKRVMNRSDGLTRFTITEVRNAPTEKGFYIRAQKRR